MILTLPSNNDMIPIPPLIKFNPNSGNRTSKAHTKYIPNTANFIIGLPHGVRSTYQHNMEIKYDLKDK